jgi:hypothetical protein
MKFALVLSSLLALTGCRHKPATAHNTEFSPLAGVPSAAPHSAGGTSGGPSATAPAGKLIVTPEEKAVGKVVRVNEAGHFVVLNFPVGKLPALEQVFNLYRSGLKVGEVKVTGPNQDENIVADITAGDAAEGDQVRPK